MAEYPKTVTITRAAEGEPGDIVGAKEAAEILNVERTRIARYARGGQMPPPIATTGKTKLWLRSEVEDFRDERGKDGLRRGPKKGEA